MKLRVIVFLFFIQSFSVHAIVSSLVLECNETAGVIGMTESESHFDGTNISHPGWRSQSDDRTYRVWSIPGGATDRTYEWSCQIDNKVAVLKIWHERPSEGELINRHGVKHDRCGFSRKMSLTYGDKPILTNLVMEGDGCEVPASRKFGLYFGQADLLPRGVADGLTLRVVARSPDRSVIRDRLTIERTVSMVYYKGKKSLEQNKLPIDESSFNAIFFDNK